MKKLKCIPIKFKKGGMYGIPKLTVRANSIWTFYTFEYDEENVLYVTYVGVVEAGLREFKRHPDQKRIYVLEDCLKDANLYDIYEFDSEAEMIMDGIK